MLLISALEIFFTWAVITLALIGIGSIVLSRFSKDYSLLDVFWMGLAISVAVLEIWNLVLPITASVTLFLIGAGTVGLALNHSSLRIGLRAIWQSPRWLLLLGVAFVLLLALLSCGPLAFYDPALYLPPPVR